MRSYLTRTIWMLSLISLATDMASEMLYPIMPMYLQSIGFSVLLIGILEGIAEALAGLSKSYFGQWSDLTGRRVPFVRAGYALSAISKPMMAWLSAPLWVFIARTFDRMGKGVRTGARDALLSDATQPAYKARVFGFHRSMDTAGAVAGPMLALVFLYYHPGAYKSLFYLAFFPGLIAIVISLLLKDNRAAAPNSTFQKISFTSFIQYWKQSGPTYRKLVTGLLIFSLINSSDLFLLLRLKETGYSDLQLIWVYIFYNAVYALMAYPAGMIADRLGLKKTILAGLFLFAVVYAGFAFSPQKQTVWILFFLYGGYAAATESIAKAWITNVVDKKETATAIGTYTGFQSIAALLSGILGGLIWYRWGADILFGSTALAALLLMVYFSRYTSRGSSAQA